jgi:hypothetical protein
LRHYWNDRLEDHFSVNALYDDLARDALETADLYSGRGVLFNLRILFRYCRKAMLSGGVVFSAGFAFLPLVMILRLLRTLRFHSFDDGRANVLADSFYFQPHERNKLSVANITYKLLSWQGPASYLRRRTSAHYTIYPGLDNVVDSQLLHVVSIGWNALFHPDDESQIDDKMRIVLLGTVIEDMKDKQSVRSFIEEIRAFADVHIIHPRESDEALLAGGVRLVSPAESVISRLSCHDRVFVYHFASSSLIGFADDPNVVDIDLLNVKFAPGLAISMIER